MTATIAYAAGPVDQQVSTDASLVNGIAEVHQQFGLHQTALNLLKFSTWLEPNNLTTLRLLAHSQFMVGVFKASLATLTKIETHDEAAGLTEYETLMKASALAFCGDSAQAQTILGISTQP